MKTYIIDKEIHEYRITELDVQNIEKVAKCILPEQYKKFILQYNGGSSQWNSFEIKNWFADGSAGGSSVRYFYGVCPDKKSIMNYYDIFESLEVRYQRLPKELLQIATDSFGNEICIGIHGDKYGKIYFWDHENEAPCDEPWWENIYFLADSFDEFCANLFNFDIDDNGKDIYRYQDGRVVVI